MSFTAPRGTELIEVLGTGSTFETALVSGARDFLVCKRLAPALCHDQGAALAIKREAALLSALQHPSLPKCVRSDHDEMGPYLLETAVAGISLRAVAERWRSRTSQVPGELVRHIAGHSITALAELQDAQENGVPIRFVHGDLSPDNIFFGPAGEIGFVDFGCSSWNGMPNDLRADSEGTRDRRGTLPYVAPELARGEAAPSAKTDLYALSAVLLFIGTGERVVNAATEPAMLVEVGERGLDLSRIDLLRGFTKAERDTLRRALAFRPEDRFSTAREWSAAFSSAC